MADLALGSGTVNLTGTVNNYADGAFGLGGGAFMFSGSGNNFVLDFGNITQGAGAQSASLNVLNAVFGPSDLLEGAFAFDTGAVQDFGFSGFNAFSNLIGGGTLGGYQVAFSNTGALGSYSDDIILTAFGSNASGYRDALGDVIRLTVRANVVTGGGGQVPVPPTIVLVGLGLALMVGAQRRRARGATTH